VPEGDSIFRAARTLHRALAGRTVTRFDAVFPRLTRIDDETPLRGRLVERVEAHGKHLLIWFSGDLVLRTHMRMNGSWHIYRPGERWRRPHHAMRVLIETQGMHAVAFSVPVAEFATTATLARTPALRDLGPDLLAEGFVAADAVTRIGARPEMEIADALLDQTAIAGIGNVYKSEVLFAARVNPFTMVRDVDRAGIERLVALAEKLLRANVTEPSGGGIVTHTSLRRTTGRRDPAARYWVYLRAGQPCRRCGTVISRRKQGPHARSTYWCARCQPEGVGTKAPVQDRRP
jgi:endonuclease VIII